MNQNDLISQMYVNVYLKCGKKIAKNTFDCIPVNSIS